MTKIYNNYSSVSEIARITKNVFGNIYPVQGTPGRTINNLIDVSLSFEFYW